MLQKNTAGQGLYVYAHDLLADAPKTGDASNITATVSKDGGSPAASATTNPTEIGRGVYWLPLSQAETNAEAIAIAAVSSTANVVVAPVLAQTGTSPSALAGITSLAAWLRGLYRKSAMDATAKTEVNSGGGTYDESTDSVEAIRERGDAAWTTGGGGGGGGSCVWSIGEKDNVVGKVGAIGSGAATIVSPITPDARRLTITQGDDLVASLGRSIDIALPYPTWLDLTGSTVRLKFYQRYAGYRPPAWLSITGAILNPGATNQTIRFELAAVITALFVEGGLNAYAWQAYATTGAGLVVTVGMGDVTVLPAAEA